MRDLNITTAGEIHIRCDGGASASAIGPVERTRKELMVAYGVLAGLCTTAMSAAIASDPSRAALADLMRSSFWIQVCVALALVASIYERLRIHKLHDALEQTGGRLTPTARRYLGYVRALGWSAVAMTAILLAGSVLRLINLGW